jgi:intein/homing endonuclease
MGLESRLIEFLKRHKEIQKQGNLFTMKKSKTLVNLPSEFTPDLCRIIGIIHGDGNMSGKRIHITDQNLEYHKFLQHLFKRTFGITLNIFHDKNRNSFYSYSKNSIVYKYLTEVLEIPTGPVRQNLRVPKFLRKLPLELQSEYVAGLFDSESHIRKRQAEIDFSTTSKDIWNFIRNYLKKIGVKFSWRIRKRRKNPEFEIFIYGKNNLKIFTQFVNLKHPEKRKRLQPFLPH